MAEALLHHSAAQPPEPNNHLPLRFLACFAAVVLHVL